MYFLSKYLPLPNHNDKYIRTKIRTQDKKVYTNFHGLAVSEDGVECEYYAIISINFLLVYENKYYKY